jgi:hypothetical protein
MIKILNYFLSYIKKNQKKITLRIYMNTETNRFKIQKEYS